MKESDFYKVSVLKQDKQMLVHVSDEIAAINTKLADLGVSVDD